VPPSPLRNLLAWQDYKRDIDDQQNAADQQLVEDQQAEVKPLQARVEGCVRVELASGCSLCLPAGWVYGVATSTSIIVEGGHFRHSFDVKMQTR